MIYIKPQDYDYIMNKFHRQDKPFDPHNRFIRNDDLFSADSGMEPADIEAGVRALDEDLSAQPHPVRRARAMEYILQNTRINCDKRDIFPALNMMDRPLTFQLDKWYMEVFCDKIPEVGAKRDYFENTGIATCWPDWDHTVPNWERLFDLGFKGIIAESEKARARKTNITEDETAFYDGVKIVYTAIIDFIERLFRMAEKQENKKLAAALKNIKENSPKTFYEAMLMDFVFFIVSEHVGSVQVRSLSNFDRIFYKYYKNDIENGVTEEEIRTDLAYFFLQFTAIGNYWNQPVFLGGCKADESTEINELSYIFLDVYDKMGIYNPKIQIKVADSTPKEFILKALDMIRRGNNSIVFVGDATIRRALENVGVAPDRARLCNIKGCYEYSCQEDMSMGMNYINLLKPLEYALHQGNDGVTGVFSGLESPALENYKTFDDFFNEYKRQFARVMTEVREIVNSFENYLCDVNPTSMVSGTYESAIKVGKDALRGGAVTNGSEFLFGFFAEIVDSLAAVKKYVFDKQKITLSELVKALDNDFEGYEKLRIMLRADRDKFGNNKELPDSIATNLIDFMCKEVCDKPNCEARGGKWNFGFHVARMIYVQAPLTASAPNGRLKGEELSKNASACVGMNREGATAAVLSTTKLNATRFTSDAALDLGLLPSAVKGEEGLEAMYGLVKTFVDNNGHAIHINVFDAETLRAAQKEPEKYQDLQIRVSGWNVKFNNMSREEQDGFIRQAEGLS